MPRASIPSAISPNSAPSQDQPSIAHSTGVILLSVRSCPLPESTRPWGSFSACSSPRWIFRSMVAVDTPSRAAASCFDRRKFRVSSRDATCGVTVRIADSTALVPVFPWRIPGVCRLGCWHQGGSGPAGAVRAGSRGGLCHLASSLPRTPAPDYSPLSQPWAACSLPGHYPFS